MILVLTFLLVYGILQKFGALTSGYHLVDDHDLVRLRFWL